jgi:hypothetical protein
VARIQFSFCSKKKKKTYPEGDCHTVGEFFFLQYQSSASNVTVNSYFFPTSILGYCRIAELRGELL